MSSEPFNLFAIIDDPEDRVRRLSLTRGSQREVADYLLPQKEAFLTDDAERIPFDITYQPEGDELFSIRPFKTPGDLLSAIQSPIARSVLAGRAEIRRITALFFGALTPTPYICFQNFNLGRTLVHKFTLLMDGQTLNKLEQPGLTLPKKLDALIRGEELLFKSYSVVRRFLDLAAPFAEATDEDIDTFATNVFFTPTDLVALKNNANQIVRKKIASVLHRDILSQTTPTAIAEQAREYGIEVQIENDQIVIPNDKKELRTLVSLLDEDYFITSFSEARCYTNSKRILPNQS